MDSVSAERDRPLIVDLDGSLLAVDSLWESVMALGRRTPSHLLLLPVWLLRGKAGFKRRILSEAVPDVALLPCHEQVRAFLDDRFRSGQTLILATGADERLALRFAERLGIFSDVIASDGRTNLRGHAKLDAIRDRLGDGRAFDYLGNDSADLPVWRAAAERYVVDPSRALKRRLNEMGGAKREFGRGCAPWFSSLWWALRPHQWTKNLLLFIPTLLAHQLFSVQVWLSLVIAFIVFSLTASSVYVANDLLDLEADRAHPRKRNRVFASGDLSIRAGLLLSACLAIFGTSLSALTLPLEFTLILFAYLILNGIYSLFVKRIVLLDVLTLASLYTIRIFAGGAAVDVPISTWLLVFSIFLFLSLALVKRYTELKTAPPDDGETLAGRGYRPEDIELLCVMGVASGLVSVLVLALYIHDESVTALYDRPSVLWLVTPGITYWVLRMWFIAHRGQMDDDPIVFTLRDPTSYVVAAALSVLLVLATL